MTTISEARAAVKTILTAGSPIPIKWPNEYFVLPDDLGAFGYAMFTKVRDPYVASFGGGRMNNRYRNELCLEVFVFVSSGSAVEPALSYGEMIATLLRSYRDDDISVFAVSVSELGPGSGLKLQDIDAGNYYAAVVEAFMHFDEIG